MPPSLPPPAARVALEALARGLAVHRAIESVSVVLFSDELLQVFRRAEARLRSAEPG